jgi:hypothetical protein
MTLSEAKAVLESLEELVVDPQGYDFGPAYEAAKRRHESAIHTMRKMVRKLRGTS